MYVMLISRLDPQAPRPHDLHIPLQFWGVSTLFPSLFLLNGYGSYALVGKNSLHHTLAISDMMLEQKDEKEYEHKMNIYLSDYQGNHS